MLRITPDMYIAMVSDILDHSQKHLNECRALLREIGNPDLSAREKLAYINSLKMHLGVIEGDAKRSIITIGE
jgi:rubrerythrin